MATTYVFRASQSAHSELTALFDFVLPARIGLWRLRKEVSHYHLSHPGLTERECTELFSADIDLRYRALLRVCTKDTWDQADERFAHVVTYIAISAFEGFCENLATAALEFKILTTKKQADFLSTNLQFPAGHSTKSPGVSEALKLISAPSLVLRNTFQQELKKRRTYDPQHLNEMLKCYRYFKEIRNCLAHNGGVAYQGAEAAYKTLSGLNLPVDVGVRETPKLHPVVEGQPVRLDPHGANGFAYIVLKLIQTLDGILSETLFAEKELAARLQKTKSSRLLSGKLSRRKSQIRGHFEKAGAIKPNYSATIDQWLKDLQVTRA